MNDLEIKISFNRRELNNLFLAVGYDDVIKTIEALQDRLLGLKIARQNDEADDITSIYDEDIECIENLLTKLGEKS